MLELRKEHIILETDRDLVIERERSSPFFSINEIPGEVSIPFNLPASPVNILALGPVDEINVTKTATHDIILSDEGFQISHGKLAIEAVDTDLNHNQSGTISAYFLSNISEFYQRIKDKKLNALLLGGIRTFAWAGYQSTGGGFWSHVHDTWTFQGSREYCFYPIYNPGYTGFTNGWMNQLKEFNGIREMARDENTNALCPAINLVYLLTQIFEEHGYRLIGKLLNDVTFRAITIPSFYGVYWADGVFTVPNQWIAYPLPTITINLQEHVPPDFLISTFLVELQKFLPIGFEVDDNTRTCEIFMLSDINPVGAKERMFELNPAIRIETEKEQKIMAFERDKDNADSFDIKSDVGDVDEIESWKNIPMVYLPGSTIYIKDIKEYWKLTTIGVNLIWQPVSPNVDGYQPDRSTDTINSKISTMPLSEQEMYQSISAGVHGFFPACNQEGNWKKKPAKIKKWGIRFLLFSGALPYANTFIDLPFAYPSNYHLNGPTYMPFQKIFDWSLCLINSTEDGLYEKLWKPWLRTFENREKVLATWRPSFSDYISFKWKEPFLINNTPYLIEKITDQFPFERPGDDTSDSVAIEARRMN